MLHPISADAATLLGINVFLWIVSLILGKTWPVDFIWSGWPPVQCLIILWRGGGDGGICARQQFVCVLVALWGYRLTHNFVIRGGIGHEDWRYTDMRTQFGKHFWWVSLFSVFIGRELPAPQHFEEKISRLSSLADGARFESRTRQRQYSSLQPACHSTAQCQTRRPFRRQSTAPHWA